MKASRVSVSIQSLASEGNGIFLVGRLPPPKCGVSRFATKLKLRAQVPAVAACGKASCFPVRFFTGVWLSSMGTKVSQQNLCLPAMSVHH